MGRNTCLDFMGRRINKNFCHTQQYLWFTRSCFGVTAMKSDNDARHCRTLKLNSLPIIFSHLGSCLKWKCAYVLSHLCFRKSTSHGNDTSQHCATCLAGSGYTVKKSVLKESEISSEVKVTQCYQVTTTTNIII